MRLLIITQAIDEANPVFGFMVGWIAEFAKHCDVVTAIGLSVGAHSLPKNVSVFSLGKERGGSRLSYVVNFYRLIIRERSNYDAVFVHMNPEYVFLGGIFWKLMGKKVGLWYTHRAVNWRLRFSLFFSDIVLTASPESFRLSTSKLAVAGHGIDVERFEKVVHVPSDQFRILSIGRLSETKGYGILLDALKLLKANGAVTKVTLIGGPLTEADESYAVILKNEIMRRGLFETITLAGAVQNTKIAPYLAQADLFVNMSKTGSLDKAVLEAMAARVPVLTSNEGLCTTLAGFEKTCMFMEGDADDFATHIRRFMHMSNEERSNLGERLRCVVKRAHDIRALIPQILGLYENLSQQ